MNRIFAIIILSLISLTALNVLAKTIVGGYDLDKIAAATVEGISKAGLIDRKEAALLALPVESSSKDPLVRGADVIRFYERIGTVLIEKQLATQQDIETTKKMAAESGGLKIGGLNPVVLAASYLDLLTRNGVITLSEAQSILDSAKKP